MIALNQYGFGPQLSMKIYQLYKQDTISMVQGNPYKLVEDIEGIGLDGRMSLGISLAFPAAIPTESRLRACIHLNHNAFRMEIST